jgi:hypothetical protein
LLRFTGLHLRLLQLFALRNGMGASEDLDVIVKLFVDRRPAG